MISIKRKRRSTSLNFIPLTNDELTSPSPILPPSPLIATPQTPGSRSSLEADFFRAPMQEAVTDDESDDEEIARSRSYTCPSDFGDGTPTLSSSSSTVLLTPHRAAKKGEPGVL